VILEVADGVGWSGSRDCQECVTALGRTGFFLFRGQVARRLRALPSGQARAGLGREGERPDLGVGQNQIGWARGLDTLARQSEAKK